MNPVLKFQEKADKANASLLVAKQEVEDAQIALQDALHLFELIQSSAGFIR